MGIGAAIAYYEENSDWLDSPEQAFEVLYGHRNKASCKKHACPRCGRKFKSNRAVDDHMRDTGHAQKGGER